MPVSFNPPAQLAQPVQLIGLAQVSETVANAKVSLSRQSALAQNSNSPQAGWTTVQCDTYMTALRQVRRRLSRVARVGVGSSREARRNAFKYALNSFDARFLATVRVASHQDRLISYEDALDQAEQTTLERPCSEPVVANAKESGGKQRLIIVPGPRRRTIQLVLRDALRAGGVSNPYEYSRNGLGPFAACAAIETAIRSGYNFWLVFDIKEFFSSVKPEHLSWIPLRSHHLLNGAYIPDEALISRGPTLPDTTTLDHINKAARLGLPMGSMVSPQIASALLGRILQGLPGDLARVSFMDDGAIGARSHGEIKAIEETLSEQLASLSAGPLALKFAHTYSAFEGVVFMQFKIRPEWTDPSRTVVCPSPRAFKQFKREVLRRKAGGESESQINDYAVRWAQSNQWLLRALDANHEETIRDFIAMSIDEIIGW